VSTKISDIKLQTQAIKPGPAKAPATKGPETLVDEIRLTGQQEIDRGSELKKAAAEMQAAAQQESDSAKASQAAAEAGIQAGNEAVAAGTATVAEGLGNVKGGYAAEAAANQQADKAAADIAASVDAGKPLVADLGATIAKSVAGIGGEALITGNLAGDVAKFQGQLAPANEFQASLQGGSDSLTAQVEAECSAAGKLGLGMAGLAKAQDIHNSSHATLQEGLGLLAEGHKLTEQGNQSKADSARVDQLGNTYETKGFAFTAESNDLKNQALGQYAVAEDKNNAAGVLFQEASNNVKVSELLAEISAIDRGAGEKLAGIAGFAGEAGQTLEAASEHEQAAIDNAAFAKGQSEIGTLRQGEAKDAAAAGDSLANQSAVSSLFAGLAGDEATEAFDRAANLGAQGDQLLAEGGEKNKDGLIAAGKGTVGVALAKKGEEIAQGIVDSAFAEGTSAVEAQKVTHSEMSATVAQLNANEAERGNTAGSIGKGVTATEYIVGIEQGLADKALDLSNQISANHQARKDAVSELESSVTNREAAFAQQEQGVAQAGTGTAQASEGAAQARTEVGNKLQADLAVDSAAKKLETAAAHDAAADVIIDKGQKYVDVANKATGSK
jgi:hypothetical protein